MGVVMIGGWWLVPASNIIIIEMVEHASGSHSDYLSLSPLKVTGYSLLMNSSCLLWEAATYINER